MLPTRHIKPANHLLVFFFPCRITGQLHTLGEEPYTLPWASVDVIATHKKVCHPSFPGSKANFPPLAPTKGYCGILACMFEETLQIDPRFSTDLLGSPQD